MTDPLEALEQSLDYMFELQTSKTGKYIHQVVQDLKQALENYKKGPSFALRNLVQAIKEAMPVIENYVDGYVVRSRVEKLAEANGINLNWEQPEQSKKNSLSFFSTTSASCEEKQELIAWLSCRAKVPFRKLNPEEKLIILLAQINNKEFNERLDRYLEKNSNFLYNLGLSSAETFFKIISTRLGSRYTNDQIAKLIVHHYEASKNWGDTKEQKQAYLESLNNHLSLINLSLENLLQDSKIKAIFKGIDLFENLINTPSIS